MILVGIIIWLILLLIITIKVGIGAGIGLLAISFFGVIIYGLVDYIKEEKYK